MKRKFLSVLVAACTALFSFSGLTGCSGGSEHQDDTYGIVTLDDFEYGNKGFYLAIGSTHMVIMPTDEDPPPTELVGGGGEKVRDPYRTGMVPPKPCTMEAGQGTFKVNVIYNVVWTDKKGVPDAGAVAVGSKPTGTYLIITFEDVAAVTSSGLFRSLGAGFDTVSVNTQLQIGLDFAAQACSSACVITTIPGSEYKDVNLEKLGMMFAQKKQ